MRSHRLIRNALALVAASTMTLTLLGASSVAPAPNGAASAVGSDEEAHGRDDGRGGPPAPISVSGSYWIELAPVLVAADKFYPRGLEVGEGGITRITAGEVDLATNAETQLLRESLVNPDLRIIMTVTEGFFRLVARKSAGIETLEDLEGKTIMLPRNTSANFFLVAMLETVGLTEDDVTIVGLPPEVDGKSGMEQMSEYLVRGDVDAISIWEPEPVGAIEELGDDAIVFQDRELYREVFNLHARAQDLADPDKRRSIVTFVRSILKANKSLERHPEKHWPLVSDVTGFTLHEIEESWPELAFPGEIVPDMLDVLEREDVWVAKETGRQPRSREELSTFIDHSVMEEALGRGR
ncbi:ABC transporter substrate-binding protein [Microbacterium sp.]|jgi:NitT/TauT family transport system substrate-binding protein|uniref:ABC transporter substrate-binding protein n=1 Tax=Microbacterium sp. TaxID=51671 RepID=UPI002CFD8B08|nr:ABC transporter substrate-binding protein [Microbacterium sp.]HWL79250.1 ABC transporter substrate-binding protein [Microbacterium sp.]